MCCVAVSQANEFMYTGYYESMETASKQARKAIIEDDNRRTQPLADKAFVVTVRLSEDGDSQKVIAAQLRPEIRPVPLSPSFNSVTGTSLSRFPPPAV